MAQNPQEFPENIAHPFPAAPEKVAWRWDVIGGEHKGETFTYAPEVDILPNVFDATRIMGPTGFAEQKPYRGSGRSYEHDLIGDAGDIPFLKLSSGKMITLRQAYRALEKEKKQSGRLLDRKLFFAAAGRVVEYFDELSPEHRELLYTEFLNDLRKATRQVLQTHIATSKKEEVTIRVYPSADTPMDSFGVDFFVDVADKQGNRKRMYCDVTLNTNKNVARGFSHLVLSNIHVPTSSDEAEERRVYNVQIKMIANRIAYNFLRGLPNRDFDVVGSGRSFSFQNV